MRKISELLSVKDDIKENKVFMIIIGILLLPYIIFVSGKISKLKRACKIKEYNKRAEEKIAQEFGKEWIEKLSRKEQKKIIEAGLGTFVYFNKQYLKYKGQVNNKCEPHGHGEYTVISGSKYVGEFINGKRHGYGVYTFGKDSPYVGDRYEGDYCEDRPCGNCVYYYANGDRYEGEWDCGMTGRGVMYYSDGTKFDGEWKHNKKHGYGFFTDKDDNTTFQLWDNGDLKEEYESE